MEYSSDHHCRKSRYLKKLSLHIALHSFGDIAGDKLPVQMLQ
ncbi:MAG: hypothetical protein WB492_02505 [Christiangramia sp.]